MAEAHLGRRNCRSRYTVPLAVSFLAIALLPTLTALNPTDPLWVPGAYDGGDLDDVVLATLAGEPSAPLSTALASRRLLPLDRLAVSAEPQHRAQHAPLPVGLRAPPLG